MPEPLRVFVSSPADVPDERLRADLIIDKRTQDYGRFFAIGSYRWEHEAMLASKHFQDAIEPPSAFDIVVLILWSRLGTPLPEKTAQREYRGIDGRTPVTGTEWEYEEALKVARASGAPDLLAFRNISPAPVDTRDTEARARSNSQLDELDRFWRRHFANEGVFVAAYHEYRTLEEFAHRLEESLRRLIERRIKSVAARESREPIWLGDPFRGLEAYEFEHAPIFFGRNAAVMKASEQLAANARGGRAFLMVLGASGSGKSSLAKAGIVPRLMKPQRISGTAFVRRTVFRPSDGGSDPIRGLANALTRVSGDGIGLPELIASGQNAAQLATYLRATADEPGFLFANALGRLTQSGRAGGRLLAFEDAKLILVVDQLEELFTVPGITSADRHLFIRLLAGLARSRVVWVIATLRADFWHRAAEIPELIALAEGQGRIDLAAPSPAELTEMIRKPAQAAGLSFEVHAEKGIGLDAALVEQATTAPGALPLLSFTLYELYQQAKARGEAMLTYMSYEALGGLEGAIANRADEVVGAVVPSAQAALPRVLRGLAMVTGPADQVPVGRAVPLESFAEGTPARTLTDALVAARLLVAASEGGAPPTIRLAHEALISRWRRAREQLLADRRDLETRSVVERQQARFAAAIGRVRRQLLLRDPDLANAIDLADRWGDELAESIRAFIEESRRRARFRQRLTAMAAVAFGLVALAAVVATSYVSIAERRAEQALDSERMEREFIAKVGDTMQELAGFVPEETEQLMRKTTEAILTGKATDADSVILLQVDALAEMAGYFHDAWDDGRSMKFLDLAQQRLPRLSLAARSNPEYTRLEARLNEIAADVDTDDDRRFDRAKTEYDDAIKFAEQYRTISSTGALASARIYRKRAVFEITKQQYAAAHHDTEIARGLLGDGDEAFGERAELYHLEAGEAGRNGNTAQAREFLQKAVALDRIVVSNARQGAQPIRAPTIMLATHLQHLGDALRKDGKSDAVLAYQEAETLITEILNTYPNQAGSRFMLDLIRHGRLLSTEKSSWLHNPANPMALTDEAVDKTFGEGFGRFKFGMSAAQVNALLERGSGPARAWEYWTGEVWYFWSLIKDSADFSAFSDLSVPCADQHLYYIVLFFHEDSLMRISYRLYGSPQTICQERYQLFPSIADKYRIPLLGTPKSWRLHWETKRVSIIGTTVNEGPMLDIIAR